MYTRELPPIAKITPYGFPAHRPARTIVQVPETRQNVTSVKTCKFVTGRAFRGRRERKRGEEERERERKKREKEKGRRGGEIGGRKGEVERSGEEGGEEE